MVPRPSQSRRTVQWMNGPGGQHNPEELEHDRLFLHNFVKRTLNLSLIDTDIPNLLNLANQDSPDQQIYSDTTCVEFHLLLIELLKLFKETLTNIASVQKAKPTDPVKFKMELTRAQEYAYALLRIARGYAFRCHIYNIAPHLNKYRADNEGFPAEAPKVAEEDVEGNQEVDEELEAIQPGNYAGWLRLVLAHFDAVEIIFSYMFARHSAAPLASINISILKSPLASDKMYPWRDLFSEKKYFPTEDPDVYAPAAITNTEILEFVEKTVLQASKAQKFSSWARLAFMQWAARGQEDFNYNHLKAMVGKLADAKDLPVIDHKSEEDNLDSQPHESSMSSVNFNTIARNVHTAIERWHNPQDERESIAVLEEGITNDLRKLYDRLYPTPPIYGFIANLDTKAPLKFTGAIHCESGIASVLDPFSKHGPNPDLDEYGNKAALSSILSQMDVSIFSPIDLSSNPQHFMFRYRVMDPLLGYQNAAAQFARNSSRS